MRKFVLVLIVVTLFASSCKQSNGTGGDTAAFTETSATDTSSIETVTPDDGTTPTDTATTDAVAATPAE